ncbi:MAG: hypothetical protein ACXVJD_07890 [Mucilaginibacter sp.]
MSKLSFITPFFIVSNLKDSVSFYVNKLGFEVWHTGPGDDPYWAMVVRQAIKNRYSAASFVVRIKLIPVKKNTTDIIPITASVVALPWWLIISTPV